VCVGERERQRACVTPLPQPHAAKQVADLLLFPKPSDCVCVCERERERVFV